jgi:hypothetical protein
VLLEESRDMSAAGLVKLKIYQSIVSKHYWNPRAHLVEFGWKSILRTKRAMVVEQWRGILSIIEIHQRPSAGARGL